MTTSPQTDPTASNSRQTSPMKSERKPSDAFNDNQEAEGFICPLCLTPFPDADDLQAHYSSAHSGDINTSVACSVCKMRFGTDIECEAHFIRSHNKTKADESANSIVQRELEKIGARLELPNEELELLKSQIKAMEESKGLITSEVLLLRDQLADSNQLLKEIKNEKDLLFTKCEAFEKELKEANDKLNQSKEENLKLRADLQISSCDRNEISALKNELNKAKKQFEVCQAEKQQLSLENRDMVQKLDKLKFEKDKLEVRLTIVEEAKNELQEKWKLKESGIESEAGNIQQLTASLENMKIDLLSTKQVLEETKNHSKDEINRYTQLLMKENNEKKDIETKYEQLSRDLVAANNKCDEIKQLYSSLTEEYENLQKLNAFNSEKLKENEQVISRMNAKLSEYESLLSSKNNEIENLKKNFEGQLKIIEEECEQQKNKLNENEYLFTSLQKSLDETEKQLVAERNRLKITMSEHENELCEMKLKEEALQSEIADKESEIKEYIEKFKVAEKAEKEAENKLSQSFVKLQESEKKLSLLEQKHSQLSKEIEDLQKEKEMLRSALKLKTDNLQKMERMCSDLKERLKRVEDECLQREQSLEIEVRNRNESIEKLEQDLKRIKVQTEVSIKQFDEVLSQKVELETKLSYVLDEKMSLFEKCRDLEEENDKLKSELLAVKSKLDDTIAALHELGRENQLLQVEQTKLMSKRWTEDDEVTNCTSCNRQFSLALRKHHCRNCLQIFCNECSSKVAVIRSHSSNKPVRVCDACYLEIESNA
ncbi:early endosome antigen 1-like isoform X1 [Dinothrombium tinctorium]|uniref:Early endosome antigen 1-like isoform X1 n=1 Tax=Dinothrombium tinctorium TaxID=1965070 RepID=A0A443QSE6_9ACAR|nr:early endosome antigen 1-like isoform X1 [Dinothrombium tinctorium]